jgi:hypothetical protein
MAVQRKRHSEVLFGTLVPQLAGCGWRACNLNPLATLVLVNSSGIPAVSRIFEQQRRIKLKSTLLFDRAISFSPK